MAGTGQPDARTRQALTRALAEVTGDQPVSFAYDLAAALWGEAAPLVRQARLADLESVREAVAADVGGMDGPEHWWPQDRSWVVTSDYDLASTYVGCSAEARIMAAADVEALPVTPETRIDFSADRPEHCW